MCIHGQSSTLAALCAAALVCAPWLGGDCGETDDRSQDKAGIHQEFARKVEQYNTLLKDGRFDDAVVLGNEARLLEPDNPVAELMVLKAKYAKQYAENRLSNRFRATLAADGSGNSDGSLRIADGTFARLVLGTDEDIAEGRRLLDASLERKIEAVDRICDLTDAQKRKLQLAGRGDIRRFFDRVAALRPKTLPAQGAEDYILDFQGPCFFDTSEADEIRRARKCGLFERGSLFSKTLKGALMDSQAAALERSTPRRQETGG